ncbi:hypothetical protein F2Q70_00008101 [Brassica cretica]|uniref:Uncharacterized protein n=1 Tax=Brassica cretica TaxID=69181 RepID=A0A8S9LUJ0_BRACR|nr:hypothetical protein F2Q70_00008101 [Brassica cretica]
MNTAESSIFDYRSEVIHLSFLFLLSTPSSDVNMTAEFELELQELFNDVKSMVKIGGIWLRLKPLPALLDMINKIVDKLRDNKDEIDMSILVATRWIVPADAAASEECVGGEEHMGRIV